VFPPPAGEPEVASTRKSPEPVAAAPSPATASAEEETSVWKRDVRASDLLKKMGWTGGAGPKAPRGGTASEKRTPRPDGPRPDSPAAQPGEDGGAADASVWKREIKAGDLLRRREKAPAVPSDAFSEGGSEPVSFWKKEISLNDLLRQPGSGDDESATAPAPGTTQAAPAKGKRRGLAIGKLGGISLGKGAGPRRTSPHTPIAIPLMRAVNLLPPDLLPQKKKTVGPAEIGAVVAAVAVIIGLFLLYTSASGKVDDAEQQLAALEAEQAQLAESALALDAAVGGVVASPLLGEEAARASALSSALETRTAWDRVLRKVTVVMPADTWLRGLGGSSATSDLLGAGGEAELSSTLTLTGYSLSRDGVAQLLSRLETIPELASVSLLAATQTALNDETVVEFSIVTTLENGSEDQAGASVDTIGLTP
jgi:Tfp pilus assembly protein PilN